MRTRSSRDQEIDEAKECSVKAISSSSEVLNKEVNTTKAVNGSRVTKSEDCYLFCDTKNLVTKDNLIDAEIDSMPSTREKESLTMKEGANDSLKYFDNPNPQNFQKEIEKKKSFQENDQNEVTPKQQKYSSSDNTTSVELSPHTDYQINDTSPTISSQSTNDEKQEISDLDTLGKNDCNSYKNNTKEVVPKSDTSSCQKSLDNSEVVNEASQNAASFSADSLANGLKALNNTIDHPRTECKGPGTESSYAHKDFIRQQEKKDKTEFDKLKSLQNLQHMPTNIETKQCNENQSTKLTPTKQNCIKKSLDTSDKKEHNHSIDSGLSDAPKLDSNNKLDTSKDTSNLILVTLEEFPKNECNQSSYQVLNSSNAQDNKDDYSMDNFKLDKILDGDKKEIDADSLTTSNETKVLFEKINMDKFSNCVNSICKDNTVEEECRDNNVKAHKLHNSDVITEKSHDIITKDLHEDIDLGKKNASGMLDKCEIVTKECKDLNESSLDQNHETDHLHLLPGDTIVNVSKSQSEAINFDSESVKMQDISYVEAVEIVSSVNVQSDEITNITLMSDGIKEEPFSLGLDTTDLTITKSEKSQKLIHVNEKNENETRTNKCIGNEMKLEKDTIQKDEVLDENMSISTAKNFPQHIFEDDHLSHANGNLNHPKNNTFESSKDEEQDVQLRIVTENEGSENSTSPNPETNDESVDKNVQIKVYSMDVQGQNQKDRKFKNSDDLNHGESVLNNKEFYCIEKNIKNEAELFTQPKKTDEKRHFCSKNERKTGVFPKINSIKSKDIDVMNENYADYSIKSERNNNGENNPIHESNHESTLNLQNESKKDELNGSKRILSSSPAQNHSFLDNSSTIKKIQSIPYDDVEKIKINLYFEFIKSHRGKGAERLFNIYWEKMGVYLSYPYIPCSGFWTTHQSSGEVKGNKENFFKRYLITRRLQQMHNKLILGKTSIFFCR